MKEAGLHGFSRMGVVMASFASYVWISIRFILSFVSLSVAFVQTLTGTGWIKAARRRANSYNREFLLC